MIRINNIQAPLQADLYEVLDLACRQTGLNKNDVSAVRWSKKSVDARRKSHIHLVCSIDCELADGALLPESKDIECLVDVPVLTLPQVKSTIRPVIVGSGPAGMMAGLLLSEVGLNPIILERGRDVDTRKADVRRFWTEGALKTTSNVQFGEGGAGTFSDGKLMTGIKKDAYVRKVLSEFVQAGAPEEILYLAKPHIGTDKLVNMVKNIRRKIESAGGEYRFGHRLSGLKIEHDKLVGIEVETPTGKTEEIPCERLILAVGHSARDTFEMLYRSGIRMVQKPFSVGARIEHKQSLINQAQYGAPRIDRLGAADYKFAVHLPNGRSAYTFCMCPGGMVVAAASENGRVVTNGMSEYARDRENANAALLVGVDERDFGSAHPLAGMYFQRKIEEEAFRLGGENYCAPAQLVGDFLKNRPSRHGGDVRPSYAPGVRWTSLNTVLPEDIIQTMQAAIVLTDKKMKGFASADAVLTGPETRSSSPIRILRGADMQSNISGLYPCGEGAGYAGGITSAAADGLRAAESLILTFSPSLSK